MQVVILLAFAVLLGLGGTADAPLAPPVAVAAAVAAYWLLTAAASWALSAAGLRRLERGQALAPTVHRQHRAMVGVQLWLVAGFAVVELAGLSAYLQQVHALRRVPLADEAVAIGVFLVACVIYWRVGYRFDRAVRMLVEQELMAAGLPVRAGWSAGEHLAFNLRHHFLFVAVPIGLILLARDVVELLAPRVLPAEFLYDYPWVPQAAILLATAAVFLLAPLMIVRIWRTRRLPEGELRSRLQRLCDRIGLRYRDILIWDTGGIIVNAGVMGVIRPLRYILISDALLEQMGDREIVAVFGHEAGHVMHHHVAYFLVFTVASMLLLGAAMAALTELLYRLGVTLTAQWHEALLLAAVAVVWGLAFGWLSRRFERQADVFGAWCSSLDFRDGGDPETGSELTPGAYAFASALENVARLNGMPRHGRNWRHGSIASRVAFLVDWARMGRSRGAFDRGIGLVKIGTWACLVAGAAAAAMTWHLW